MIDVRKLKFLLVSVEYFTKWIESKPVVIVSSQNIKGFLWKKHYLQIQSLKNLDIRNRY